MKRINLASLALAVALAGGAITGLTACEKRDGPAERAGEQIDEAVDDAKDVVD